MANRSDFNSKLPRSLKRMLTLGSKGDVHHAAVVRKLFLEAHADHKRAHDKMLRGNPALNEAETGSEVQ